MDTSKEYKSMSVKAYEIQKLKKHHYLGDIVVLHGVINIVTNHNLNEGCNIPKVSFVEDGEVLSEWVEERNLPNLVWLPRQDQLQEIMIENKLSKDDSIISLIDDFRNFCFEFRICESFEQLWLSFVMEENYNKQWNTETKEWEK